MARIDGERSEDRRDLRFEVFGQCRLFFLRQIGETFDAIGETCYRSYTMSITDSRAACTPPSR